MYRHSDSKIALHILRTKSNGFNGLRYLPVDVKQLTINQSIFILISRQSDHFLSLN